MRPGPVTGVVETWDDPAGLGTIRTDDGDGLDLQCTNLADGTRSTSVGTRVTGSAVPGHRGRWQAVRVETIGAPAQ